MPVTRNDVAKAAGVSPGVVSYVLNAGPRPVSAAARQRVLEAVAALGYRPDGLARSLRTGRSDTFGVILPDASNPFFAELARAIEDSAYRAGKSVLVCNSADDIERERTYLKTLVERRVDGIILVSTSGEEDLSDVLHLGIPIVTMDRYRGQAAVSTVRFDNRHAGFTAAQHLLEHGHTAIAMVGGPRYATVSDERVNGYTEAMARAHQAPILVHESAFTFSGGSDAVRDLLSRTTRITAILCSSDVQAIGAAAALRRHCLKVPEEMALVSIDGTTLGAFAHPPLTSMRQPIDRMAQLAVDAILRVGGETHRALKGRLILRQSCGCTP